MSDTPLVFLRGARQTGKSTLVRNNLADLLELRRSSQAAFSVIEQNFRPATPTDVVGVGLGAGGFMTPVMAGLLHTAHSLGIMITWTRLVAAERSAKP